ncbi:hypothetical protein CWS02_19205 [Enterobacter sp. EA-1]|nr:hypothetical protein CWS02_19205 [Enterobacter sp. EA-1]
MLSNFDFNMYYLYAFAIINGVGWTYVGFAQFSAGNSRREKYVTGNSLLEISLQVGMFLAAAASRFIYKYFSFNAILLVNALMFVFSAITINLIKYRAVSRESDSENYTVMLRRGWSFLS